MILQIIISYYLIFLEYFIQKLYDLLCIIQIYLSPIKNNKNNKLIKFCNSENLTIENRVKNTLSTCGPLYYFFDGYQKIVVIGNYQIAKNFYKLKEYRKIFRSYEYLGYVFNIFLKFSIGAHSGKDWLQMKKPLSQFFTTASVKNRYNVIIDKTNLWINKYFSNKKNTFLLKDLTLDRLTIRIISHIIYGELEQTELNELYQFSIMHNKLMMIMGRYMPLRYPLVYKFVHLPKRKFVDNFWKKWTLFNNKQKRKNKNADTLFNTMIKYDVYNNNDLYLYNTLYEIMLFNLDIMIDSFANLIWNIAINNDIKKKLFNECKYVCINNFNEINNLRFLDNIINESARLYPGIILTFPETIVEPITLNGYHLPKGTKISLDTQMINRDENLWHNPHEFNPSRFNTKKSTYLYHRFGLGPRKCLGNIYADYILKIGLISLIKKFDITTVLNNNLTTKQKNTIPNISNYDIVNKISFIERC